LKGGRTQVQKLWFWIMAVEEIKKRESIADMMKLEISLGLGFDFLTAYQEYQGVS
jgi:hypothetical protein